MSQIVGQLKKDKEQATQKVRELEASLEAYIKKIRVSVVLCFLYLQKQWLYSYFLEEENVILQ